MKLLSLLVVGSATVALCGCASFNDSNEIDPVRQRLVAEVAQATSEGTLPGNEKQFIYPHWPELTARVQNEIDVNAQAPAH